MVRQTSTATPIRAGNEREPCYGDAWIEAPPRHPPLGPFQAKAASDRANCMEDSRRRRPTEIIIIRAIRSTIWRRYPTRCEVRRASTSISKLGRRQIAGFRPDDQAPRRRDPRRPGIWRRYPTRCEVRRASISISKLGRRQIAGFRPDDQAPRRRAPRRTGVGRLEGRVDEGMTAAVKSAVHQHRSRNRQARGRPAPRRPSTSSPGRSTIRPSG